jgi:RNA polymerase sigma-70 factor (ECF subfamily)
VDLNSISILIPKSKEGDQAAREELLLQVQEYLEMTAKRHLDPALKQKVGTSDIVQQSFIRVIEKFKSFRGESSPEFRAWLRTIVVNEINNIRRSYRTHKRDIGREQSFRGKESGVADFQPTDHNLTPSSEAISAERLEKFHEVLAQLSPHHAEVIKLRNLERLPFAEIGEKMGRSEEAVSKLWYRAILKFEENLRKRGDFTSQ